MHACTYMCVCLCVNTHEREGVCLYMYERMCACSRVGVACSDFVAQWMSQGGHNAFTLHGRSRGKEVMVVCTPASPSPSPSAPNQLQVLHLCVVLLSENEHSGGGVISFPTPGSPFHEVHVCVGGKSFCDVTLLSPSSVDPTLGACLVL